MHRDSETETSREYSTRQTIACHFELHERRIKCSAMLTSNLREQRRVCWLREDDVGRTGRLQEYTGKGQHEPSSPSGITDGSSRLHSRRDIALQTGNYRTCESFSSVKRRYFYEGTIERSNSYISVYINIALIIINHAAAATRTINDTRIAIRARCINTRWTISWKNIKSRRKTVLILIRSIRSCMNLEQEEERGQLFLLQADA